ncbi:hypothetical protein [Sulfurimonas sp.]|uniref:hypothetical protein n=1 Tax=Sulfurimonas sp. TaxID=2022749 RepID=UPI00262FA542|nr:hypothetical protein [Sulfurimonas sp.]
MDFSLSTWMMLVFVIGMALSFWKLYAFMPNKHLKDDDTTQESQNELIDLILHVIKESDGELNEKELHDKVKGHENFDIEHFWRFNENKLRQLLNIHYLKHPHTQSIKDVHKDLNT